MTDRRWSDGAQLQRLLEHTYREIQRIRMAEIPMLNPALSVQALNFRLYREHWAGLLITPWFMNLMLLPQAPGGWTDCRRGEKMSCRFPAGNFEFVVAGEPALGPYGACSLYSPMFQFDRQEVAVAAADAAWRALFGDAGALDAAANDPARPAVSRRDLLLGRVGARRQET